MHLIRRRICVVTKPSDVSDTYLLMHALLLPRDLSPALPPSQRWIALPRVEPQKPRRAANEPAHICLQTICNIFYIQVSAVTAPLSLLARRLQHVSGSKHEHERGTWWAYQSTHVSVVQEKKKKDKNNLKEHKKSVSACHVGLKLHVGQDDWLKHGMCILVWQHI